MQLASERLFDAKIFICGITYLEVGPNNVFVFDQPINMVGLSACTDKIKIIIPSRVLLFLPEV